MDDDDTRQDAPVDERRPWSEPQLVVEGRLEELTMTPTFLLEAYG